MEQDDTQCKGLTSDVHHDAMKEQSSRKCSSSCTNLHDKTDKQAAPSRLRLNSAVGLKALNIFQALSVCLD